MANETPTEYDYGFAYAEYMVEHGDVDHYNFSPVPSTCGIPSDDYATMVADGIENPSPVEYWAGYNSFYYKWVCYKRALGART